MSVGGGDDQGTLHKLIPAVGTLGHLLSLCSKLDGEESSRQTPGFALI